MKEGDKKDKFLIFGFLRKALSNEEMEVFQDRLKDEDFQEKVSDETVSQYGRIELKTKLDDLHETVVQTQKSRRFITIIGLLVLLALIGFGGWYFMSGKDKIPPIESEQIFASYFDPYANLFEQKGTTTIDDQGFLAAMIAYTNKDFTKSIRLFEDQLNKDSSKKSLQSFYYGIALLANDQSDKALNVLKQLNAESTSTALLPQEALNWYLAMAYLNENNAIEARVLLEKVAALKKNSFKQNEASEILKVLK